MSTSRGLAGKQGLPNNGAASRPQHGARVRLLTRCLMDTAAFPHSSSPTTDGHSKLSPCTFLKSCCSALISTQESHGISSLQLLGITPNLPGSLSQCATTIFLPFQRKYLITALNNLLDGHPKQLCEMLAPKQTHTTLHLQISFSIW